MDVALARLRHLSYWYPSASRAALDDVSLDVDGGVTLVAGPSGGGKSTLLRALNGLVPHFHGGRIAGSVEVAGLSVIDTPTRRLARTVGFVFQDPELQTVYDTVEREVAFGLENLAFPRSRMRDLVEGALHEVGAGELIGRRVRTLSGGERQRLALASSLAVEPQLVVLDEPTSQLDAGGTTLVLNAVRRVAEHGRTVMISEHRFDGLLDAAAAVVEVDKALVQRVEPASWHPPSLSSAAPHAARPGGEVWSVTGLVAGFHGRPVLDEVTLAGGQGEVVGLSGPNGSGKTTLLRTIAGLLQPLAGRVERRGGRVAYLPQNPGALLHRPTVRAEVELTLERAGGAQNADQILDALGLSSLADRYPRDLSSGERQRAAIAAVLAGRPQLVLLDEPTRGMDVAARSALISLVSDLREHGSSIVLATHDDALRHALADRTAVIRDGKIVEAQRALR